MKAFGDNLKKIRAAKEWSQQHTADKVGVKLRTYQAWEEGRSCPTAYLLVTVAKVIGIKDLVGFLSDPDYGESRGPRPKEKIIHSTLLEEKYLGAGLREKLAVNILLGLVDLD